jgi:methylated-DNA-[protein]-cysteine S-methyltransferase
MKQSPLPGRAAWAAHTRLATPLGPLLLAATPRGRAGAWFDDQAHHPGQPAALSAGDPHLLQAAEQVFRCYWQEGAAAAAAALQALPLDPQGSAFQQAVWQALRAIPAGQTTHYGAIAQRLGRPEAARAVGAAVGRNPIAVLVPCHRVLGRDGSLTGYAGGLQRKQALLLHEGTALQARGLALHPGSSQLPLAPDSR